MKIHPFSIVIRHALQAKGIDPDAVIEYVKTHKKMPDWWRIDEIRDNHRRHLESCHKCIETLIVYDQVIHLFDWLRLACITSVYAYDMARIINSSASNRASGEIKNRHVLSAHVG